MNTLRGEITEIITEDHISLVKLKVHDLMLTSIVLDTPAYIKKGNFIRALFKETEVIIAREGALAISVQNRILCMIEKIHTGKILCELTLAFDQYSIRSIITKNACEQLQLRERERVVALIKTNEISLSADD